MRPFKVHIEQNKLDDLKARLEMTGSGSLGSVTKPFQVYGDTYEVPMQRRGLAYSITYRIQLK